jgi:hypothetical protein
MLGSVLLEHIRFVFASRCCGLSIKGAAEAEIAYIESHISQIIQSIKTKGAVPAVIGVADRQACVGPHLNLAHGSLAHLLVEFS